MTSDTLRKVLIVGAAFAALSVGACKKPDASNTTADANAAASDANAAMASANAAEASSNAASADANAASNASAPADANATH
jgi:hypothetical protein